jgi:hypothetical protein
MLEKSLGSIVFLKIASSAALSSVGSAIHTSPNLPTFHFAVF